LNNTISGFKKNVPFLIPMGDELASQFLKSGKTADSHLLVHRFAFHLRMNVSPAIAMTGHANMHFPVMKLLADGHDPWNATHSIK
jgi:hypothetical protein